jgi:hypothetical protein
MKEYYSNENHDTLMKEYYFNENRDTLMKTDSTVTLKSKKSIPDHAVFVTLLLGIKVLYLYCVPHLNEL